MKDTYMINLYGDGKSGEVGFLLWQSVYICTYLRICVPNMLNMESRHFDTSVLAWHLSHPKQSFK